MIPRALLTALMLAFTAQLIAAGPIVVFARHAEKADAAAGADPKNPELSPAGRSRAEALGRLLRDTGIGAIFATEYTRTQQTAEEVRRTTKAAITIVPAKEVASLVEQLKAVKGIAVVVGHSNTLPEIIKALGVDKPLTIDESEYDNVFIWNRSAPREVFRLRY